MPPVFEDAVFDADLDEITTAETDKGLHILQVMEERSAITQIGQVPVFLYRV